MSNKNKETSTFSSDVGDLCAPLYELGIYKFHFVRVYNDNSRFSLCNDPLLTEFINQFYSKKYSVDDGDYLNNVRNQDISLINFKETKNSVASFAQERMNSFHDAYLYKKTKKDFTDFVYFSGKDKENYELYFRNQGLFERFYYFFLDKGAKLIEQAKETKICPTVTFPKYEAEKIYQKIDFIKKTNFNRLYLDENIYLTKREFECLALIGAGKTYEEIAKILYLSSRTIINHIENIKSKTSLKNINELVSFSVTNNFPDLIQSTWAKS